MSEFENLLKDLELLKKSEDMEADDKIKMASEDDNQDDDDKQPNPEEIDNQDDAEDDDEKEPMDKCGSMAKSQSATLEDGSEGEVIDAGEMIKCLQGDINDSREMLTKSIQALQATITEQGEVLKALGEQVVRMANAGSGRKSVMATAPMAKSEPQGTVDMLAKCERAMAEGKLSGMDLSVAEAYTNRGMAIPQEILNKL